MILFLDTSALFKLYHQELDSEVIEQVFTQHAIEVVFLSELTRLEFASSVWKKVRTHELSKAQAIALLEAFESDFSNYTFVPMDEEVVDRATHLLNEYGHVGLRTLDSIQLSTAIQLKEQLQFAITSDKLLQGFFQKEGLPT